MIQYRFLRPDEWDKLGPLFEGHEDAIPHPTTAIVAVAEEVESGALVGCLPLQLQLHAEPLIIHKDYRGKVTVRGLVRQAEQALSKDIGKVYYAFSEGANISKLCQVLGMEKLPYEVYRKVV